MSPPLRLAVTTPVVTRLPGAHARWEEDAGIAEVARIAEVADELGFHHLTCSEHVAVPVGEAARRGATYWDPLATFGYLAARTHHIRLATNVVVLGYHHPLALAKRYGTLDRVSGGRLVLGVGVGSLEEEFALLDAPFADRGPRADDALRALRASLSVEVPEYEGPYHRFAGLVVDPCAVQAPVPLWVGGRTRRSLRRAVTLADGWCPFAVTPDEVASWLAEVDVPDGFEVVLGPGRPLDPLGDPGATERRLHTLAAAGATIVAVRLVHHSLDHCLEQLAAVMAVRDGMG